MGAGSRQGRAQRAEGSLDGWRPCLTKAVEGMAGVREAALLMLQPEPAALPSCQRSPR